jgi:hypothetical protein
MQLYFKQPPGVIQEHHLYLKPGETWVGGLEFGRVQSALCLVFNSSANALPVITIPIIIAAVAIHLK